MAPLSVAPRQHTASTAAAGGKPSGTRGASNSKARAVIATVINTPPKPSRRPAADAAQVGLEACVEDQQSQAHPMQGLHLQRAEGLGLVHPLDGTHQA